MRIIIFTILLLVQTVSAQQSATLLYVDNSITINRATSLTAQITKVVETTNDSIIFILGDDDDSHETYNFSKLDLLDSLPDLCLKDRSLQSISSITETLEKSLDKFSNESEFDIQKFTSIKIHLFINISTFKNKRYYERLIRGFLARNNLINRVGVNKKIKFIVHLDYPKQKEKYDNFFEDISEKLENIIFKKY
tara:strand:- start:1682 stop:2263 length:582 start_codon:yes stop_codon:yes gene_type:complete